MKIGIAQLNSNDQVEDNLKQIQNLIDESRKEKPEIIFFPENSLYFRIDPQSQVQSVTLDGEVIKRLKKTC